MFICNGKDWLLSGCFRILVSRSTTRRCLRMTNRLSVLAVEALCVLSVLINVLKSIGLTYAETIEKGWLLSGCFRILVSRSMTRRCLRMTNRLSVLAVEALCVLSVLM